MPASAIEDRMGSMEQIREKAEYVAPELVIEGDLSKVTKEDGGGFSA